MFLKARFYSLSRKTVNTRENFWNVNCFATDQMRDETATDNPKPQHGVDTTSQETTSWLFLSRQIFMFLLLSNAERVLFLFQLEKILFFKKPNYRTDLERVYNLSKFTMVKVYFICTSGEGFSTTKKYGSKIINHSALV